MVCLCLFSLSCCRLFFCFLGKPSPNQKWQGTTVDSETKCCGQRTSSDTQDSHPTSLSQTAAAAEIP